MMSAGVVARLTAGFFSLGSLVGFLTVTTPATFPGDWSTTPRKWRDENPTSPLHPHLGRGRTDSIPGPAGGSSDSCLSPASFPYGEAFMGREIRRVPKGWEHPRDEDGKYRSCHDEDYETAAARWIKEFEQWRAGTHPEFQDGRGEYIDYFWEWESPPDEELCRPKFESPATHYQIYQTVSEGTPVSPVFASKEEMVEWLVAQGSSRKAAEGFAKHESAPSFVISDRGMFRGVDSFDA